MSNREICRQSITLISVSFRNEASGIVSRDNLYFTPVIVKAKIFGLKWIKRGSFVCPLSCSHQRTLFSPLIFQSKFLPFMSIDLFIRKCIILCQKFGLLCQLVFLLPIYNLFNIEGSFGFGSNSRN